MKNNELSKEEIKNMFLKGFLGLNFNWFLPFNCLSSNLPAAVVAGAAVVTGAHSICKVLSSKVSSRPRKTFSI